MNKAKLMTFLEINGGKLEVEQAWARAHRPGPDFRLEVHRAQAWKSPGMKVAKLGEPFFKARGQAR